MRPGSKSKERIWVVEEGAMRRRADDLATEEPLEIRLKAGDDSRTLAITMRTPGADFELAAGFLYGEGILQDRDSVGEISYCADVADEEQLYNVVSVELRAAHLPDLATLERHFYTSSACGVCGKTTLDALHLHYEPLAAEGLRVTAETLYALPEKLGQAQGLFAITGGLHAAALFDVNGELIELREDVGRHNAVDKVVGWALLNGRLPLSQSILLVSGRASYEILQKAVAAGLPIVCAVSAPSNLAVAVARHLGVTLVGFLRGRRFNVYAGAGRIALAEMVKPPSEAPL